jgi:hypothetical protein
LLRSLQEIQPFLMEEDCGGGQGLVGCGAKEREKRERLFEGQCVKPDIDEL